MYQFDKRIVMTLDAGGTNFVFSAIQANEEIVQPVCLPSNSDNLPRCLDTLISGFTTVKYEIERKQKRAPVAISFAFPGPADYTKGVIGDLPNLKAFRGGVALGPFLESKFKLPVFINNDGDLFAYGEALGGFLPEVNNLLAESGSRKRYKNLLGVTLGTGFGAGFITNGNLHLGDNSSGGDVWLFRNKKNRDLITEENAGIAAIVRMYSEKSGDNCTFITPKNVFEIAEGLKEGNRAAALETFSEMGEEAGDTIAHALTLVDGLVVIGGGLTGASRYFMPALMKELNGSIGKLNGETFPRLEMKVFNLDDDDEKMLFIREGERYVKIPGSEEKVVYEPSKRTAIGISKLGASKAIALGAYAFALDALDHL